MLPMAKNLRHMTPLSASMLTVTPSMCELRHVVTIVDYKILGVMDDVRWNESYKCLHMGFEASVKATSPTVLLPAFSFYWFLFMLLLQSTVRIKGLGPIHMCKEECEYPSYLTIYGCRDILLYLNMKVISTSSSLV